MRKEKFAYWKEGKFWVGYFQDYPDYWTPGWSLEDLKEHLKALYEDLTCAEIPGIP